MKKIYLLIIVAAVFCTRTTNAQLTLTTQFINPCGNDAKNEFIVAKTGANPVNIADIIFGSYNPVTSTGDPQVNYSQWWHGTNTVTDPYPTFSTTSSDICGTTGVNCYGFLYPSISADAADIATLLDTLNNNAGCSVFLTVPSTNIIPANSNVIFFLGAGYRNANGLCGFDSAFNYMNFSNHCSNGQPVATYYAVFGNASGAGGNCTSSGGYFSNSARRVSTLFTFLGGDTSVNANYSSSFQDYDPGTGVTPGNAGLIVPNGSGGTTWINNQGCVPLATTVLAIRLDYFTGILKDKTGVLKWRSSFEENIRDFEIEKSLNGRNFSLLKHVAPKNISGSEYTTTDETLATGNNFYRLKIINQDGTIDYSQVVRINYKKGVPSGWSVYPNPADGDASIIYQSVTSKKITINLTDMAGKLISQQVYGITPGNNKINIPAQKLSAGIYTITVFSDGEKETSTFVKK